MINLIETPNQSNSYSSSQKCKQPAIHISALPSRHNAQMELPSFSIPIQYNLGSFKKIGEDVQFDLEPTTSEEQCNQWDNRMAPTFSLMHLKPLLENRDSIEIPVDLKYDTEVKNENNRLNFDSTAAVDNAAIDTDDILGKETMNEGQTISPDFEIERYQNYQNNSDKRFEEANFDSSIINEANKCDFVCENDFLCKNSYDKSLDTKRNDFEECNLLDTDNGDGISNFDDNL